MLQALADDFGRMVRTRGVADLEVAATRLHGEKSVGHVASY